MEQHLHGFVGVERLVDLDAGVRGEQRHPEKAVMGGTILAGFRPVVRRQHDEEGVGVRIDGVVDQRHADGIGHHAGKNAVRGEGGHGAESAGEGVLRDGAGHHGHVLFGDAEANAAAQLVGGSEDAVDVFGFAREDALHQVAGAHIEEGGVLHRPGKPRLARLPRGHHLALREDEFGGQRGGALDGGVIADGAAGQRGLHALHQILLRNHQGRGGAQPGGEILDIAFAERFSHHRDIGAHFAFDAGDGEAEFAHGVDIFRVRQRGAVGIARAFQTAVFRALARVRDHHRRPAGAEAFARQAVGVGQLPRVVAVGFDDVPAQRKPVVDVRRGQDFEDGAVDAEAIVVQRDDEVLHAEMAGQIPRFISHPFLGFGIARDDERARGEAAGAVQGGEAQAGGDAVAAGTGGRVGEGVVALHVPARSAPSAEARQILGINRQAGEVAGEDVALCPQCLVDEREQGVKQRAAVTGRPDKAVAAGGLGIPGVERERARSQQGDHLFGFG